MHHKFKMPFFDNAKKIPSYRHAVKEDDIILEKHVPKLEHLENTTKKLLKDAKKYETCIIDLMHSEDKITSDLSNSILCHEEDDFRKLVEEWISYVSKANSFNEDLAVVVEKALVQPLKKFQNVFAEIKGALKKHEQSIQECVKVFQKVQKLQEKEKTGTMLVKLEHAKQNLTALEEDYKHQNHVLKVELPLFYEGRVEYFQPSLEALMKAEVEHGGNLTKLFNEAVISSLTVVENEHCQKQSQRFSYINSLSIVIGS